MLAFLKQKAQDSFSQYIMFLEMCMSLIFRDKKGNLIYLLVDHKSSLFLNCNMKC